MNHLHVGGLKQNRPRTRVALATPTSSRGATAIGFFKGRIG